MLSLQELRRCAEALNSRFAGHRIERVIEPSADSLAVVCYGRADGEEQGQKKTLLVSCHPELGRIAELDGAPKAPQNPPKFTQWLRSRLAGARLVEAEIVGSDRELALRFDVPGEDGVKRWSLVLSLIGRRANTYLLDPQGCVAAAQRPFDKTRKELGPGDPWRSPEGGSAREGEDRFAGVEPSGLLRAIEAEYGERTSAHSSEGTSRRIAQALRKERKQAQRRLEKLELELGEADQANVLQSRGELLKGVMHELTPGQREVVVADPSSGEAVAIPLDPKLGPKQNLEAIFKRAQKLIRRLAKAGGQVGDAQARVDDLDALAAEVDALDARAADGEDVSEDIEAVAARPVVAKIVGKRESKTAVASKQPPKPTGPFKDLPTRLHPKRYRSKDELEIWVGRSDEANDYLTTRLARGKDLFFHVEDSPGSHVILRTEGRSDPPQESLLDACELAVHFSKQRNAPHAEVHAVPIKNVKKPKGAKPGLVYVTGGQSIRLRREDARLERLLSSRIES